MLRLRDPQESLWAQLLPPQARTLSGELTAVDEYLADDRFFDPYRQRFRTLIGRSYRSRGDLSPPDVPEASLSVRL
jgi:hypothetical protein